MNLALDHGSWRCATSRRSQLADEQGREQPRYALSPDWEPERQRLALLEQLFDEGARSKFIALGLGPGARCLELGAGGGSIARWLCQQVGETGTVTATDLDTRWLDAMDEPNLSVLRHDLLVDDFPAGSFDFIYARAVLEHIADRARALPRIVEWLAPGGWLFLQDFSMFPVESSAHPPLVRAYHAFESLIGRTGTDYTWTRTFPAPLSACGLDEVDASVEVPMMRGGSPAAEFIRQTVRALAPRMVEAALIEQDDLSAVEALLTDSDLWDLGFALMSAWGQKSTG